MRLVLLAALLVAGCGGRLHKLIEQHGLKEPVVINVYCCCTEKKP